METKEISNQLLTPTQLAERVNMSLKFIKKHISDRRLPGMVKVGRFWRFDPLSVEKAVLSGKILLD